MTQQSAAVGVLGLVSIWSLLWQAGGEVKAGRRQAGDSRAFSVNAPEMTWRRMEPQMGSASPERALLYEDPVTHASRFMVRVPKNFHIPRHWHTANETHTVISGTFIMETPGARVALRGGGFNFTPGGTPHEAWTPPVEGALLFVTVDGPYDLRIAAPGRK